MRQTAINSNVSTIYFALSTSNSAPTGSNSLFEPVISLGAGYVVTVFAETYITLAPGTYTYYVMVYFSGGTLSSPAIWNATSDSRMFSDLFAVQM